MSPAAILLYHRIADGDDFFGLRIPPSRFAAEMKYVREQCHPMSLEELADAEEAGCVPPRAVAVTFDDGYTDNLTEAAPILSSYGIPATFFVTTELLDRPHEHWWDALTRLILDEPSLPRSLDLPFDDLQKVTVESPADRRAALRAIHARIRHLSVGDRGQIMLTLAEQIDPTTAPGARPLVATEVLQLAAGQGFDIGAHTTHHLSLPSHPDPIQRQELCESKVTLEGLLKRPVRSLAYPFGETSVTTTALASAVGFATGVCIKQPPIPGFRRLTLPRIEVTAISSTLPAVLDEVFAESPRKR